MAVGVLALQGGFAKHIAMLEALGEQAIEVRKPDHFALIEALIIPGGESTTIKLQLRFSEMETPLKKFIEEKPVFGTCAGLILLRDYSCLDVSLKRNAYGRQCDSFSHPLEVNLSLKKSCFPGIFIRAPKIEKHGPHVKVLSRLEGSPVLVQQDNVLAASFHPELSNDPLIHAYFLSFLKKKHSRPYRKEKGGENPFEHDNR